MRMHANPCSANSLRFVRHPTAQQHHCSTVTLTAQTKQKNLYYSLYCAHMGFQATVLRNVKSHSAVSPSTVVASKVATEPVRNAVRLTFPYLMPLISITATAVYSGALFPGLPSWIQALAVGSGPLVLHVLLPLLDWLMGPQPQQPLPALDKVPPADALSPRLAPLLTVLAHSAALLLTVATVASAPLRPPLLLALAYSLATSAASALAASHELLHSRNPVHGAGAVLFLTSHWWFPYVRAHPQHHLHVATPTDYTSARKGQSVYDYIPKYVYGSCLETWQLDADACRKTGKSPYSLHNSTLVALGAQVLITLGMFLAFGPAATAVHLASCAVVLLYVILIDYVLHYGLFRPGQPSRPGRYMPVTPYTSWNSSYLLENAVLFKVLHHSDHHMHGTKSYGVLQLPTSAPQFPAPINFLAFSALLPALWAHIMDPLADEANQRNLKHLEHLGLLSATQ